MYLDDIPGALAPLSPVVDSGFSNGGHGPMRSVSGIILHHTAGPPSNDTPSLHTVIVGRPDLAGPLANCYVSRSGHWYGITNGEAYHAGVVFDDNTEGNTNTIGIECEGTGVNAWPRMQYLSIVLGTALLAKHYRVPISRIKGHKEVCKPVGRKVDPNFDMNQFRVDVTNVGADDMSATTEQQIQEIHDALFSPYTPANHHMNIPDNAIGLIVRIAHRLDIDVLPELQTIANKIDAAPPS